jgi:hypothetical protein
VFLFAVNTALYGVVGSEHGAIAVVYLNRRDAKRQQQDICTDVT